MDDYDIGSVIEYRPTNFASLRRVRVLRRVNIGGVPGFVARYVGLGIRGEVVPDHEVSGYDCEIERVIRF